MTTQDEQNVADLRAIIADSRATPEEREDAQRLLTAIGERQFATASALAAAPPELRREYERAQRDEASVERLRPEERAALGKRDAAIRHAIARPEDKVAASVARANELARQYGWPEMR